MVSQKKLFCHPSTILGSFATSLVSSWADCLLCMRFLFLLGNSAEVARKPEVSKNPPSRPLPGDAIIYHRPLETESGWLLEVE